MGDSISIIMPVLNEAGVLTRSLHALQDLRARGVELIVVDGGSRDGSLSLARPLADRVVISGAGRAQQMNAGADYARGEILLFLHADTTLPPQADSLILAALRDGMDCWGRFDVRLDSPRAAFRVIETAMNWRSALSGVATGDQGIFVRREHFERVGCFDAVKLMEDVALSKKLRGHARPRRIRAAVTSSARKWENQGILRTVVLMWTLRAAFFFGVHPDRLADLYYGRRE